MGYVGEGEEWRCSSKMSRCVRKRREGGREMGYGGEGGKWRWKCIREEREGLWWGGEWEDEEER